MTKQLAAQLESLAKMARRENISIEIVPHGLILRAGHGGKMQLLTYEHFATMTVDEVVQFAKGSPT